MWAAGAGGGNNATVGAVEGVDGSAAVALGVSGLEAVIVEARLCLHTLHHVLVLVHAMLGTGTGSVFEVDLGLGSGSDDTRLYVGNIPRELTQKDLQAFMVIMID